MEKYCCCFCKYGAEVENVCGKLHVTKHDDKDLAAHHKCMQYSACLIQYKTDKFGGFEPQKVTGEARRARSLKCAICKTNKKKKAGKMTGASAGCAVSTCPKTFHYYCANVDKHAVTKRLEVRNKKKNSTTVLYRVFCSKEHDKKYRAMITAEFLQNEYTGSDDEEESPIYEEKVRSTNSSLRVSPAGSNMPQILNRESTPSVNVTIENDVLLNGENTEESLSEYHYSDTDIFQDTPYSTTLLQSKQVNKIKSENDLDSDSTFSDRSSTPIHSNHFPRKKGRPNSTKRKANSEINTHNSLVRDQSCSDMDTESTCSDSLLYSQDSDHSQGKRGRLSSMKNKTIGEINVNNNCRVGERLDEKNVSESSPLRRESPRTKKTKSDIGNDRNTKLNDYRCDHSPSLESSTDENGSPVRRESPRIRNPTATNAGMTDTKTKLSGDGNISPSKVEKHRTFSKSASPDRTAFPSKRESPRIENLTEVVGEGSSKTNQLENNKFNASHERVRENLSHPTSLSLYNLAKHPTSDVHSDTSRESPSKSKKVDKVLGEETDSSRKRKSSAVQPVVQKDSILVYVNPTAFNPLLMQKLIRDLRDYYGSPESTVLFLNSMNDNETMQPDIALYMCLMKDISENFVKNNFIILEKVFLEEAWYENQLDKYRFSLSLQEDMDDDVKQKIENSVKEKITKNFETVYKKTGVKFGSVSVIEKCEVISLFLNDQSDSKQSIREKFEAERPSELFQLTEKIPLNGRNQPKEEELESECLQILDWLYSQIECSNCLFISLPNDEVITLESETTKQSAAHKIAANLSYTLKNRNISDPSLKSVIITISLLDTDIVDCQKYCKKTILYYFQKYSCSKMNKMFCLFDIGAETRRICDILPECLIDLAEVYTVRDPTTEPVTCLLVVIHFSGNSNNDLLSIAVPSVLLSEDEDHMPTNKRTKKQRIN